MMRRIAFAASACALAATLFAAAPGPKLDELEEVVAAAKTTIRLVDFVAFPKYDSAAISPDGTRLATGWIDGYTYQRAIAVIDYPSMKPVIGFALPGVQNVVEASWASDRRLMFQVFWPQKSLRRQFDPLGVMVFTDVNGGNPHILNNEAFTNDPLGDRRQADEALAGVAHDNPASGKWPGRNMLGPVRLVERGQQDQALIQTVRAHDRHGGGEGYGAFQLGLMDNKQTRVATLPVSGGRFVTGPDHRVALATGVNARNETVVYYLPESDRAAGKNWKLVEHSGSGERGLRPVAWTGNGEEYYALDGRNGPTRAVVIWNAANNTQRLLYRHPSADMDNVALDPAGKAWMFYGNDHFPVYWYPDPDHPFARLHRMLLQKAPRELVEIVSASDNFAVAVARVGSARRPPVYIALDVNTGNSAGGLFTFPTLRGTRLSRVEPIEFLARDGLVIRGYLTTPEDGNNKARTRLPLLVIAHDAPLGEPASAGYEYERQLFASRGYAVLQVNRRGSPGRGAVFERAGDGKWGRETQDDFADAVRWAIRDGVADAERVCFYGSGYGAYSAMVAAAHEPAMFKCVIGVAGVYDMPRMLGDGKKDMPAALAQVLGTNMAELKARSPISLAGSIKAKVLLMPQKDDEISPPEQSNRMRTALRDAGNAPQFQMIGQEYDGLHTPTTRANAYDVILKFLEQQVGH